MSKRPVTLYDVQSLLVRSLTLPEETAIHHAGLALVQQHNSLSPTSQVDVLSHQGESFAGPTAGMGLRPQIGPPHASLIGQADLLVQRKKTLAHDRKRIMNILGLMSRHARSLQDFRDLLPEVCSSLLPELSQLSRTREEAYSIQGNERAMRDYHTLRGLIEFYAASRLIS